MHGAATRKVAPATSDITEVMYFAASDTHFVGWRSRACYVLGYTLNRRFGHLSHFGPDDDTCRVECSNYPSPDDDTCRVGCCIEMTLKLPQSR